MERREKRKAKSIREEDDETMEINRKAYSDSDDEAANEDLTLKIVEKARARASHAPAVGDGVVNVTAGEDITVNRVVMEEIVKKKKAKKKVEKVKKKKKVKKVDDADIIPAVTATKEDQSEEALKDAEVVNLSETTAVANSNSDNSVLKRLLRGPRYFDPPDKSWGACFNCGEEGHSAVNCTSARRKKPCFACGSLEHEVKQCQKGQDCFICKGQGHRARDCPQKMKRCSSASEICLKCGASAHAMFSCNNDYLPADLKDLQCYACKRFGHLCCANYFGAVAGEASCYKCGHTGHYGQECRGSHGETSAGATPSSCFKCGEEGHFARDCKTSAKPKKRTRDSSTPAGMKYFKHNKGNKGHKSAPEDFGKSRKKKTYLDDESPRWSGKPKRRGGWIPDDSDNFPSRNGWRSPMTPNKNHSIFDLTAGGQGSSPFRPFKKKDNFRPGSSSQHRDRPTRLGFPTDRNPRYSRLEEKENARRAGQHQTNERSGMRRNHDKW